MTDNHSTVDAADRAARDIAPWLVAALNLAAEGADGVASADCLGVAIVVCERMAAAYITTYASLARTSVAEARSLFIDQLDRMLEETGERLRLLEAVAAGGVQ